MDLQSNSYSHRDSLLHLFAPLGDRKPKQSGAWFSIMHCGKHPYPAFSRCNSREKTLQEYRGEVSAIQRKALGCSNVGVSVPVSLLTIVG